MPENNTKSADSVRKKGISAFYSAFFFSKEISGMPPRISRFFSNARFFRLLSSAARAVAYTSTRTFGCMFTSFGLLSLLLHLAKYYFAEDSAVGLSALVIGAVFAIVSIPLLLIDEPVCIALQDFPITDFIFFEFFSIKRMRKDGGTCSIHPIFGVIIGVIPAIIGYFLPLEWVAFSILGLIFVSVAFVSPEFPFLFTLIAIPYISLVPYSEIVLCSLVLLTLLSFFRKVMFGKRVYVFGISDVMILLFVLVIIASGVIGGGRESTSLSLTLAVLSLCYIPAANMIVNRRLADCAVNAVIFSALPCAVYSIVMYIISWARGARAPQSAFMLSADALALLFAVAFSFVIFVIRDMKRTPKKAAYVGISLLLALAIFTTECAPVLIVLLVGLPAYAIIVSKKAPKDALILLAMLPLAILFLPSEALDGISEFFGMEPALTAMKDGTLYALRTFLDNAVFGVGGDGAKGGVQLSLFSSYIGLACRFGIFAILLIFIVVITRNRQVSVYRRFLKSSSALPLSYMSTLSIFVFMAHGWFFDITASPEMYCLFLAVFGMSTAALRISKREYDDRHGYFDDQESSDSYVTNIILR